MVSVDMHACAAGVKRLVMISRRFFFVCLFVNKNASGKTTYSILLDPATVFFLKTTTVYE